MLLNHSSGCLFIAEIHSGVFHVQEQIQGFYGMLLPPQVKCESRIVDRSNHPHATRPQAWDTGCEPTRARENVASQPANGDFHRFSRNRGVYMVLASPFCVFNSIQSIRSERSRVGSGLNRALKGADLSFLRLDMWSLLTYCRGGLRQPHNACEIRISHVDSAIFTTLS